MHKVSIKPHWTIALADGGAVPPRLLTLLVQVEDCGSLAAACQRLGLSYRHAWDLVRQGESLLGAALLAMERGRGSRLTPLGEKLVWADRRIAARLSPALDSLASELELELDRVMPQPHSVLRVHASYGYSIEKLIEQLRADGVVVDRKYVSSQEAAASLHDGACDLCGFHVPLGAFEARGWESYMRWLEPSEQVLIELTTRRQGLMVQAGNPKKIYDAADLARPGVRFINRQRGSGTRFLLDCLLEQAGVGPDRIVGYEQGEHTHAAVAAFVGSDMADVAFGLELPARQFKLDFIPLASERYFLLARRDALAAPQVAAVIAVLRDPAFRARLDALPGYDGARSGQVRQLDDVLRQAGIA